MGSKFGALWFENLVLWNQIYYQWNRAKSQEFHCSGALAGNGGGSRDVDPGLLNGSGSSSLTL